LHGYEPRVSGVTEPLPGDEDEGPGPAQDDTLLGTDGGVGVEAGDQVPGARWRESEDCGRAVHGPGDVALTGSDAIDGGVSRFG